MGLMSSDDNAVCLFWLLLEKEILARRNQDIRLYLYPVLHCTAIWALSIQYLDRTDAQQSEDSRRVQRLLQD